jgi:uncharacterized protein YqcC (DUF446 family)
MDCTNEILEAVRAIEGDMRRIGYWSEIAPRGTDVTQLYAGVSFEQWLQFVFLPSVVAAAHSGDFGQVPPYRVGLAALRQYDYHSVVEEAHPLMRLCRELENLIDLEKSAQLNGGDDGDAV